MPTYMAEKYSKDDLNESYRVVLSAINLLQRQARKDSIGQFLSQDEIPPLGEKTLEEFYSIYEVVASITTKLGADENLSRDQQKVLANSLYRDYRRRDYYAKTISRFVHSLKNPEKKQEAKGIAARRKFEPHPLTFVELEQRYQCYSQRKARRRQELGLGPTFENWRLTEDCPKPEELFQEN